MREPPYARDHGNIGHRTCATRTPYACVYVQVDASHIRCRRIPKDGHAAVPHLKIRADVNVVEVPKLKDRTMFVTRPTTNTRRLPNRSATTPQKCDETSRPIMKPEESTPA